MTLPQRRKKERPKARRRFTPREYASVIERQNGICVCGCGEDLGKDPAGIHYDHRLPMWMGGADTLENLDALIVRHHISKTSGEAKSLAKVRRIVAGGSHRKRNLNVGERELRKILEGR